MKRENVMGFIDRRIHQSMVDGISILSIQSDITARSSNMTKALTYPGGSMAGMGPDDFEIVLNGDLENISNARLKYTAFYVSCARKRISDLNWIAANKKKFPRLSNSQIFNLVKLKEKLLSNSVVTPPPIPTVEPPIPPVSELIKGMTF